MEGDSAVDHSNSNSNSNSNSDEFDCWWSVWKESHGRTCRARKSLVVTPLQVLDYTKANAARSKQQNDNFSLIFWSLPGRQEVTLWSDSNNNNANNEIMVDSFVQKWKGTHNTKEAAPQTPAAAAASSSSGLFHYMTSTLSATLSALTTPSRPARPAIGDYCDEQDDALREWDDEQDDNAAMEEEDAGLSAVSSFTNTTCAGGKTNAAIGWDRPVLNMELTETCLDILESALASNHQKATNSTTGSIFPTMLPRRRTATTAASSHGDANVDDANLNTAVGGGCWKDWIQSISSADSTTAIDIGNQDLLARLSDAEADFLLQCLSKTGRVTLIPADKEVQQRQDLVVLAPPLDDNSNTTPTATKASVSYQVMASWWELNTAQTSLEQRRQQWSDQADSWAQKALQEKQKARQQNRQATTGAVGLTSFKIHKLYLKRLEDSEGVLLNLIKSQSTLEESWHQRQIFSALETSTKALQTLRHESQQAGQGIDNIETLMEAYREEVDHIEETHELLTTGLLPDYDEADLLNELAGLTLDDDNIDKQERSPDPPSTLVAAKQVAGVTAVETPGAVTSTSSETVSVTLTSEILSLATETVLPSSDESLKKSVMSVSNEPPPATKTKVLVPG